jgi:cell division protein FtsB
MSPMKRRWLLVGALATVGVLFIAVFPARTYLDQHHQRQQVVAQLKAVNAQNRALDQRIKTLNTDAEVERLAREQYNLVRPGEEAYAILPTRQAPAPPQPAPKPSTTASRSWFSRTWNSITSIF